MDDQESNSRQSTQGNHWISLFWNTDNAVWGSGLLKLSALPSAVLRATHFLVLTNAILFVVTFQTPTRAWWKISKLWKRRAAEAFQFPNSSNVAMMEKCFQEACRGMSLFDVLARIQSQYERAEFYYLVTMKRWTVTLESTTLRSNRVIPSSLNNTFPKRALFHLALRLWSFSCALTWNQHVFFYNIMVIFI